MSDLLVVALTRGGGVCGLAMTAVTQDLSSHNRLFLQMTEEETTTLIPSVCTDINICEMPSACRGYFSGAAGVFEFSVLQLLKLLITVSPSFARVKDLDLAARAEVLVMKSVFLVSPVCFPV